jgi:cell division FtsZ-interacting protein ZapD
MKSKISIIAALLLFAPFLRAESDLQPIVIRLTRLASDSQKEVIAPAIVVGDTKEARIRLDSVDCTILDVSVSPKLEGDKVALTIRFFEKDKDGKQRVVSVPIPVVAHLGTAAEVRIGEASYRIIASLDVPPSK